MRSFSQPLERYCQRPTQHICLYFHLGLNPMHGLLGFWIQHKCDHSLTLGLGATYQLLDQTPTRSFQPVQSSIVTGFGNSGESQVRHHVLNPKS
ncbi:hypothetical protein Lalb_Chr24g0399561 [Lupinus albus]|uniref:Uncharacterized protein n=1 Tax=Lupinus albus TaxID=3870 RepID=A0A6A4N854_LUPAL|nr:hypothetical protein Lalb_Chr24g0399561 [Lupinus albus]